MFGANQNGFVVPVCLCQVAGLLLQLPEIDGFRGAQVKDGVILPLKSIVLQPGETDNVMWASFGKVDWMIRTGKMCRIIGHQFYRQEKALRLRNMPKFGR